MSSLGLANAITGISAGVDDARRRKREDAEQERLAAGELRAQENHERQGALHDLQVQNYQTQIEGRRYDQRIKEEIRASEQMRQQALQSLAQAAAIAEASGDVSKIAEFYNQWIPDGKSGSIIKTTDGTFILQATDNSFSMPLGKSVNDVIRAAYAVAGDPEKFFEHYMAGRQAEEGLERRLREKKGVLDLEYQDDERRMEAGMGGVSGRGGGGATYAKERSVASMVKNGIPERIAVQIAEGAETPLELASGLLDHYMDVLIKGSKSEKRRLAETLGLDGQELSFSSIQAAAIKQAQSFMTEAVGPDPSDPTGFRSSRGGNNDPAGIRGGLE